MSMNQTHNNRITRQGSYPECLVLSFLTGFFTAHLISGTYQSVASLVSFPAAALISFAVCLAAVSLIAIGMYIISRRALAVFFVFVMIGYFLLSVSYQSGDIYYVCVTIALTGLAVYYFRNELFETMSAIPFGRKGGLFAACLIGVFLCAFIAAVTILRYRVFVNTTFDFGIFAQMFENMKKTGQPITSVERQAIGPVSHFRIHFSPIYYVMLPVYALFSSPVTVQFLQAFVLGLAVIPLYLLCRHYGLSGRMRTAVCALYALFPATSAGTFYDFHENCCLPVLFFSVVLAMEKKKDWQIVLFGLLFLMVKEDAAFYLVVLGIFFALSGKDKRRGLIMAVVSCIYFFFALKLVSGDANGGLAGMRYRNMMSDRNGSFLQVFVTILTNPAYSLRWLLDEAKWKYAMLMFIPLNIALLQRRHYARYLLFGSMVLFNLLPDYAYAHEIGFQYQFGTIACLFYIAVMTVAEWRSETRRTWFVVSFASAILLFGAFNAPRLSGYIDNYHKNAALYREMEQALETVPANESVLVTSYLMPHLYFVSDLTVVKERIVPTQEYIVVDLRPGYQKEYEFIAEALEANYHAVKKVEKGLCIYQKNP